LQIENAHTADDRIRNSSLMAIIKMKKLLPILDTILLFASPIAILFFLIGVIMLPVELSDHPNYLEALEEEEIKLSGS